MVDLEGKHFCNAFAREGRLLSSKLAVRRKTILDIIESLGESELVRFDSLRVLDNVLSTPQLRSDQPAGIVATAYAESASFGQAVGTSVELWDEIPDGRGRTCWRWEFSFRWSGPDEFGYWPDVTGANLQVFDNNMEAGLPPTIKWHLGPEYLLAFCFTPHSVGRSTPPGDLLERAADHVQAYVGAFNQQVKDWATGIETEALQRIEAHQQDYREGVANRDQLLERFRDWRTGPLELAPSQRQPGQRPPNQAPPAIELPSVISEASLEEIVKIVNRWVDAVEHSPAAYMDLEEERLSDQIVATLNGSFAHAHREVFIGGGKSDIYVSSKALNDAGLPDVYVGEAKIWEGRKRLITAINQSLDNFTQRIINGILVVIVKRQKSFISATNRAMSTFATDPRVLAQVDDIADRPVFHLRSALDTEAVVTLCLVMVDMTRPEDKLPKLKGTPAGA